MEEDLQEKHVCKFCSKSFPCGRSLGGHMRSHVIAASASEPEAEAEDDQNNNDEKEKLTGYGLRENPKKTWRISDNSTVTEDALFFIHDKLCKECGRGFPSWKALFGHMKRHSSEKSERVSDQDNSWMMDSQSDNEATTAPSKKRRSKRRTRRYMVPSTTTTTTNSTSTSLSEVEQEQEEVAMSLIMLSRDVGNCFEVRSCSSVRTNLVSRFDSNKKKKKDTLYESEVRNNSVTNNKIGFSINGFKLLKSDDEAALDDSEAEIGKNRVNETEQGGTSNKNSSIKRKILDSELKSSNSLKNSVKRGKFECTTCNRIFHSYQALGGHRASHKKIKGCFASRNDHKSSDEISIETETENLAEDEFVGADFGLDNNDAGISTNTNTTPSKSKVHECPICLKVFASGQALGGHKRSHMSSYEIRNCNKKILIQESSVPEISDFLDLNLPATEDESNNRPWWIVQENNHKQEPLVGLKV